MCCPGATCVTTQSGGRERSIGPCNSLGTVVEAIPGEPAQRSLFKGKTLKSNQDRHPRKLRLICSDDLLSAKKVVEREDFHVLFKNCLFILAWFVFGGVLSANPLTWQLTSVVFGDGTIVTGSFVFNADTTTSSMLSMTTSGGSSVPATSSWVYNINNLPSAEENSAGLTGFEAVDAFDGNEIGAPAGFLYSDLGPLMTNAGGTILLHDFVSVGTCGGADLICGGYNTLLPFSNGSGKFTSASAVPQPSTLILLRSAVVLAGLRPKVL